MIILRPLVAASMLVMASACDVNVANNEASADANQAEQQQSDLTQLDPQAVARAQELARAHGSDQQRQQMRQQAMQEMQGLRLVVDQAAREVRIYRGDRLVQTHDVAVGTEENPTPVGEFAFNRVDLNPRWVPPDSEWAEDREPQPPGDPDNPMGRARLVYKMPYTIHGTDNLDSLGKAVSHGSIRLANEHVIPLAEMMLKAGGAWQGQQWFQQMVQNRTEEYQIELQQDVPLKILPKDGQGQGQQGQQGQNQQNQQGQQNSQ